MNHFSKVLCLCATTAIATLPAIQAATIETYTATPGLAIPDGNPSGLASTQTISTSITEIQSVTATLEISGTFNGDLYAYLTHGTGFAVLLNRTGRSAANSFGYDDDGFDVIFDDLAPVNIHNYQGTTIPTPGSPLTGTWQPDGRTTDPDFVVDTDPPNAPLASFQTLDANGGWTLFVADLSGGDGHTRMR